MNHSPRAYARANAVKAQFDDIYNAPDPRNYYISLGHLDYHIPTAAKPVFRHIIDRLGKDNVRVVDIGCSYGVNAAMLRYDLTFEQLVERYDNPAFKALPTAEAICRDADLYSRRTPATDASFVGLDVSSEAAGYARAVGLHDETVDENFESDEPSDHAAELLADVDLVITTGAVGYVTGETFRKIAEASGGDPPIFASFVLRQYPYDEIAAVLERRGLETEYWEGRHFRQRAFADEGEAEGALKAVSAVGKDPEGLEACGSYYADFFLSRPRGSAVTLDDIAASSD